MMKDFKEKLFKMSAGDLNAYFSTILPNHFNNRPRKIVLIRVVVVNSLRKTWPEGGFGMTKHRDLRITNYVTGI
jgi:hypothetical protein